MNGRRMIALSIVGALMLVGLLLVVTGVSAGGEEPVSAAPLAQAGVVSNTLSYQGRLLNADGTPVEGMHMMAFRVYAQAEGGTPLWSDSFPVPVEAGLFHVTLDVGPTLFDGQALWLGVQVEGDAKEMTPRQPLLPAPYALYALSAPWSGLTDVPAGLDDGDDDTTYTAGIGLDLAGTVLSVTPTYRLPQGCSSGKIAEWDGAVWVCGDDDTGGSGSYWSLSGNAGIDPAAHFLGTTDGVSLTLAVSGTAALRLEPHDISPNLIGGSGGNSVAPGVMGAVIGGGGGFSPNRVTGDYNTIGGGLGNTTDNLGTTVGGGGSNTASGGAYATVSGGAANWASGAYATVGGGSGNLASGNYATAGGGTTNTASGEGAVVAGGYNNTASDDYAAIGGGAYNTASDYYVTVGGGLNNTVSKDYATVGGGSENLASGDGATVCGGFSNSVSGNYAAIGGGYDNEANGDYATVVGGDYNKADGNYSFAAGLAAHAIHPGSFVWASSGEYTPSWYTNTFTARAPGGVRFLSYATGITTGVQLTAGGSSWASISDRNAKENFADVDAGQVLETLAAMPIQTWNLKSQSPQMRHIGPVAQDFNGEFAYLFGEVESPVHINTMDAVGISLAAAQGLYELSNEQAARIEALEEENAALRQEMDGLEARLVALESAGGTSPSSLPSAFTGWWWPVGGLVVAVVVVWPRRRNGILTQ